MGGLREEFARAWLATKVILSVGAIFGMIAFIQFVVIGFPIVFITGLIFSSSNQSKIKTGD